MKFATICAILLAPESLVFLLATHSTNQTFMKLQIQSAMLIHSVLSTKRFKLQTESNYFLALLFKLSGPLAEFLLFGRVADLSFLKILAFVVFVSSSTDFLVWCAAAHLNLFFTPLCLWVLCPQTCQRTWGPGIRLRSALEVHLLSCLLASTRVVARGFMHLIPESRLTCDQHRQLLLNSDPQDCDQGNPHR